jgi:SOS-response transcriptional repressor LexA
MTKPYQNVNKKSYLYQKLPGSQWLSAYSQRNCKGVGIASTSLVSYYLRGLMEHGYISRGTAVSRAIRLTAEEEMATRSFLRCRHAACGGNGGHIAVPFLGYIVARAPIPVEPLPGNETVEISRALFGRDADNLFALRAKVIR